MISSQIEDSFTEKWFSREVSLVTGLYQLTYNGQWRCVTVSEACFQILDCTRENFLEDFQRLSVRTDYHGPEKTVGAMLDEIVVTQKQSMFISVRSLKNKKLQYIKGTMAISHNEDGLLCVLGQITDVSEGYIHFLMDTTYEHSLLEQLRLHIAQHSNRVLYAYDIAAGTTRLWNEEKQENDILAHLYTGIYSEKALEENPAVLPESLADVKQFFADIHNGVPSGELKIHIRMTDGQSKWYHFIYSSFFEADKPVTALISVEDITERHEQEIVYSRYVQSVVDNEEKYLIYLESCLICDRVDTLSGQMLEAEEKETRYSHSKFGQLVLAQKFRFEEAEEAVQYFSCKNLLRRYTQGERLLKRVWKARFNDDTLHWLSVEVVLLADPYDGHVKAFISILDVTEEREEHLSILQRADYDAMTGLLRRDVGERQIREYLADHTKANGILLALDLDDLKSINDTLGHANGDKAIIGIAHVLKGHFRKDDILIRAGGDEFLVFLPGAGKSISSIELSLAVLLRKLSGISIGEQDERTIHCSIGCAVELPDTDTFDALYRRADTALYHVKRSGKNNFAFFEPAMLEENYQFKIRQALPVVMDMAKEDGLQYLLEVVASQYPGIVHFNLTQNFFRILTAGNNVERVYAPGKVDAFWKSWQQNVHPDDWENTFSSLSRNALLASYARGQRSMHYYYRNLETIGYVRTEVVVSFFTTDAGDICAFLFFRWETAPEKELEFKRLNKLFELSAKREFEYICLINVRDKSYNTFSRDSSNSHAVPEIADFELATKHIRDTQIPPEEREAYYKNAALDHVLEQMSGKNSSYSYRYTMLDGVTQEAMFSWYEDSHAELLMTVKRMIVTVHT